MKFKPGDIVRVRRPEGAEKYPRYYCGDGIVQRAEEWNGREWVYVTGTWDEEEGVEDIPFEAERVTLLHTLQPIPSCLFCDEGIDVSPEGKCPCSQGRDSQDCDPDDCTDSRSGLQSFLKLTPQSQPELRHPNSARFHALLAEAGRLHDAKQADYGRGDDPFANVRSSEEWGIEGWVGAMVRLNDKVRRLQTLARKGHLINEAAVDSFMDIAVYALIACVLFEENRGE